MSTDKRASDVRSTRRYELRGSTDERARSQKLGSANDVLLMGFAYMLMAKFKADAE